MQVMSDKKNTETFLCFLFVRHDCIFNLLSQPPRPKRQQAVVQGTLGVKLNYILWNPPSPNLFKKNLVRQHLLIFLRPFGFSTKRNVIQAESRNPFGVEEKGENYVQGKQSREEQELNASYARERASREGSLTAVTFLPMVSTRQRFLHIP